MAEELSEELQECRACDRETHYILRPDVDSCQKCPPGLSCDGTDQVEAVVRGSAWVRTGSYYNLTSCPAGYSVHNTDGQGFNAGVQQCAECLAGEECTVPPCTRCSPCQPGTYKSHVGTSACEECPKDTYRGMPGAEELGACQACPEEATTRGLSGQVSLGACHCRPDYYNDSGSGTLRCWQCPVGAECSDGTWGVDTRLDATGAMIWTRDGQGRMWLQACPSGYRMENTSGYERQECQKVPKGMFVASNADSSFTFQRCPDGMACLNGNLPVPVSKLIDAEMTLSGYSSSAPGAWTAGDTETFKQAVRASLGELGDAQLDLEISEVCFGGSCQDLSSTQRRRRLQEEAGAPTVLLRFQTASPRMSSAELKAKLESAQFEAGFASSMAAHGMAGVTSAVAAQAAPQAAGLGTYELVGTQLLLRTCPVGYLIVNSSVALEAMECKHCLGPEYYSLDPTDGCRAGGECPPRECARCPVGAECGGGDHFKPRVANSTWEEVQSPDGYRIKRLAHCPAGYVLVRQAGRDTEDECRECPYETYSIVAASWDPAVMVAPTAVDAAALCRPCEYGASCLGGDRITPEINFWRLPRAWSGVATAAEEELDADRVYFFECQKHACLAGGECAAGREGPVCGLCKEGFALSGTVCRACGDASSKVFQAVALALIIVIFLAVWWFVAWAPFFRKEAPPEREPQDLAELSLFARLKLAVTGFFDSYGKTVTAYAKIIISFWQIMATFESTYTTEWPAVVEKGWGIGNAFSLNIFNFPGPNCLVEELSHLGILQLTTLIPAAIFFLLYIPSGILRLLGEHKQHTYRYKQTRDHFWHYSLFWLFLIYPIVSITSVKGLKCREIGKQWLLEVDLEEECPWLHPTSITFIWTIISVLVYPIGIPLFAYWELRQACIPELAMEKKEHAILDELLVQYKEHMSGTVYRDLALNIGGGQSCYDERLITNRMRYMYDDATESGQPPLTRVRFEQYLFSIGIVGLEDDMQDVLQKFDTDQNGIIGWEAFAAALMRIVRKEHHVMGLTTIEAISDDALFDLCRFRWQLLDAEHKAARRHEDGEGSQEWSQDGSFISKSIRHTGSFIAMHEPVGHKDLVGARTKEDSHSSRADRVTRLKRDSSSKEESFNAARQKRDSARSLVPLSPPTALNSAKAHMHFHQTSPDGSDRASSPGSPGPKRVDPTITSSKRKLTGLGLTGALSPGPGSFVAARRLSADRLRSGGSRARALLLGDNAGRQDMLDFLFYEGSKLVARGVIAFPTILWNNATVEERDAMDRLGFLLDSYKVQHYQYELLEMARKFTMTGLIIFLWPGSPEQLAIAVLVTALALVYVLKTNPFANPRIGSLQGAMLAAQAGTLFYGLMLRFESLDEQLHRNGASDKENVYSTVASGVILVLLTTVIFLVPPLTLLYDNRRVIQTHCVPGSLRHTKRRKRARRHRDRSLQAGEKKEDEDEDEEARLGSVQLALPPRACLSFDDSQQVAAGSTAAAARNMEEANLELFLAAGVGQELSRPTLTGLGSAGSGDSGKVGSVSQPVGTEASAPLQVRDRGEVPLPIPASVWAPVDGHGSQSAVASEISSSPAVVGLPQLPAWLGQVHIKPAGPDFAPSADAVSAPQFDDFIQICDEAGSPAAGGAASPASEPRAQFEESTGRKEL